MLKIMIAPSRYVQGPKILPAIGEQVKNFGDNVLVTGGKRALAGTGDIILESLSSHGLSCNLEQFLGESSRGEIGRLKRTASEKNANVIMAVGGGKAIDAGKAVAYYLGVPVVIVPTIASTDAPCSSLSIIYTEEGAVEEHLLLRRNPDLVFVDTDIIARAPERLLVSGMGDALATMFEAEACLASSAKNVPGGYTTATALTISRLCYETLMDYGYLAKVSCVENVTSMALEKVVEANILMSGIGFESAGLAAAHAIHDGLTVLKETNEVYHGEKVAFGTLTQVVMENKADMVTNVLSFCKVVGLPVTLKEINITDTSEENIMKIARAAVEDPGGLMKNMPFPVDADTVYNAIITADALGRAF